MINLEAEGAPDAPASAGAGDAEGAPPAVVAGTPANSPAAPADSTNASPAAAAKPGAAASAPPASAPAPKAAGAEEKPADDSATAAAPAGADEAKATSGEGGGEAPDGKTGPAAKDASDAKVSGAVDAKADEGAAGGNAKDSGAQKANDGVGEPGGGHASLELDELHLDGAFTQLAPAILQSKGLELPDGAIEMVRPLIFDAGKLRKELFEQSPKAKAMMAEAKKRAKGGTPPTPIVVELLEAVMAPHAPAIRALVESLGGGKDKKAEESKGDAKQAAPGKDAGGHGQAAAPPDAKQGNGDPKKLLEVSRNMIGQGDADNWGTDGSLKDEGLQHPAFTENATKGGYEGSFKCNIFVGEALYRSGFMSPGAGEDHQPTHHYADVNDIASDIEVVAKGGKPKFGVQWFDVVEHDAAQAGDILVIRGKYREDVSKFMKSGKENHGHIEILSDVQRDDGNAQIRHITTIGAGSKEAHEQSHDHRTTFGEEAEGKFTINKNAWVIRPRIR